MKELAQYDLEQGGFIVVELDDSDPGYDRIARGRGDIAARTGKVRIAPLEGGRAETVDVGVRVRALAAASPRAVAVAAGGLLVVRLRGQD